MNVSNPHCVAFSVSLAPQPRRLPTKISNNSDSLELAHISKIKNPIQILISRILSHEKRPAP